MQSGGNWKPQTIVNINEITMKRSINAHAQPRVEQSEIRHFFLDEALQNNNAITMRISGDPSS